MSDIECTQSDTEAACCVNAGCGNTFDPACEGFNGECDCCAALAADHFAGVHDGAHSGVRVECSFCLSEEPADAGRVLATAA
jgi:hypothetical protein